MIGEKLIEEKVEGNKLIRIFEFKDFPYDFEELLQDITYYHTDDWEAHDDHEIYYDRLENFHSFDVDKVYEWLHEIIEEAKQDELYDYNKDTFWAERWLKPLEEAQGFTIYIKRESPTKQGMR